MQWSRDVLHTSLGYADELDRIAPYFGGTLPEGMGSTAASALGWSEANRGYLHRVGPGFSGSCEIDEDLVALGVGNDDVQLLDLLAGQLDAPGEAGERARRLWRRYLRRDPSDAGTERSWLAEHRDAMFFSYWAGYAGSHAGTCPSWPCPA